MRNLFLAFIIIAGLSGCKSEEAPKDPFATPGDQLVLNAKSRLESIEAARAMEEQVKRSLLAAMIPRAELLSRLTKGDPFAIDQAQTGISELLTELNSRKVNASYDLDPDGMIEAAEAQLVAAKMSLDNAERNERAMHGSVRTTKGDGRCGSDGCGGDCGDCEWGQVCLDLFCTCIPDCTGKTCGADGCGGVCGTGSCPNWQYCSEEGVCRDIPTETVCHSDCRHTPSGTLQERQRVKDYSAQPHRKWEARRFETLDELNNYLKALKTKQGTLQAIVTEEQGNGTQITELESKLTSAKTARELLETEIKEGKRAISDLSKELKRASEEEAPALQIKLDELTAQVNTKVDALSTLQSSMGEMDNELEKRQRSAKLSTRIMPEVRAGLRKIEAEINLVSTRISEWEALKREVALARDARDKADAKLEEVKTALQTAKNEKEEKARAANEALEAEYAPRLEIIRKQLGELKEPAITEPLISLRDPDSFSIESDWIIELEDPERLSRQQELVAGLMASRKESFAKLDVEARKKYPNWEKEIETMEAYLKLISRLDISVKRVMDFTQKLERERERILEALPSVGTSEKSGTDDNPS